MEVFSVFATMSLVDLLSGPLGGIRSAMSGVSGATDSLGGRLGRLAVAMAPVVVSAGVLLGALGLATSQAIAFESAMADVAKVVNFETQTEFKAMSATVMDMAGRIPMAAEGIAAIIAAAGQSGVAKQDLAEFAEQAAKMGVAFDLTGAQAGKMMADWRAGMNLTLPQTYALADAANHLSNNMNATAPALGEVIQRVGAAAMSCGLAETQVAALGSAFLSAGASPEIAATALKSFTTTLVKGTAMSKEQAGAFQSIGFSATQMAKDMQTDAQGTIFKVLQAIADKPKELQMSLLTELFGQESIGAIAPLLKNMGLLDQAFKLVGNYANYAGSMQAEFDARSKTTANALQLLSNKLTNLAIAVGTVFLPAVSAGATFLGVLADGARAIVETPFGQWLLEVVGAVSALLVGMAALSASMWFFSAVGPMLVKALAPAGAALAALGAPFWVLIAVAGALYLAFKTNFAGVADTLNRWWKHTTLVVRGVVAVFQNITDGVGTIKGELAKEIKAAGLEGLVTTVTRLVFRIQKFFAGIAEGMAPALTAIDEILLPAQLLIADFMLDIESLFGNVDSAVGGSVSTWVDFGRAVGEVVGGALKLAAQAFVWLMDVVSATGKAIASYYKGVWSALSAGFGSLAATFSRVWSRLEGVFTAFKQAGASIGNAFSQLWAAIAPVFERLFGSTVTSGISGWEHFGNVVGNVVVTGLHVLAQAIQFALTPLEILINLVRLVVSLFTGDFAGAADALRSIVASLGKGFAALGDLFGVGDSIRAAWADIMTYFDSINLFESGTKILMTLADGIKSAIAYPFNAVADVFAKVRNLLPFSDAKEGPFSTLTTSGGALMTTLAEGVQSKASALYESVKSAFGSAMDTAAEWWAGLKGLVSGAAQPAVSAVVPESPVPPSPVASIPPQPATAMHFMQRMPQMATPLQSVTVPPTLRVAASVSDVQIDDVETPYERRKSSTSGAGNVTNYITITNLNLPNVSDAQSFESEMQRWVGEYNGASA